MGLIATPDNFCKYDLVQDFSEGSEGSTGTPDQVDPWIPISVWNLEFKTRSCYPLMYLISTSLSVTCPRDSTGDRDTNITTDAPVDTTADPENITGGAENITEGTTDTKERDTTTTVATTSSEGASITTVVSTNATVVSASTAEVPDKIPEAPTVPLRNTTVTLRNTTVARTQPPSFLSPDPTVPENEIAGSPKKKPIP